MAIDPPYRLDPFRNIVSVSWSSPTTIFWAFQAEVIGLEFPSAATGYHFRNIFGDPSTVTLPDGRIGYVTGDFPTVSDVIFNPGPETSFLAWPWWLVGPDTDDTPGEYSGYHSYDIPDSPTASFSHTWPFFGYTYQNGLTPAIFVPAGELSVTFGPIVFTVDGVDWTTSLHVAFFAVAQENFGAAPNSMTWLPFFSATFEPP